jgi:DNA-binding transcriptional regulator YiaG
MKKEKLKVVRGSRNVFRDLRCKHADAQQSKAIREREHVSQTAFANDLNLTSSLVSKGERGEKRPSGASLKLRSLGREEWTCRR